MDVALSPRLPDAGVPGADAVPLDFPVLSLFAGVGGLDLGVGLAVPGARALCYVERDAYAAAALVARMDDEALHRAPVWDDVATFDARPLRGRVACVIGGFPCQDLSAAGKMAGLEGARSGLWGEFARIIAECRPPFVFAENVPTILSAAGRGVVSAAEPADEPVFVPVPERGAARLAAIDAERELVERACATVLGDLADLGYDAEWIVLSAADAGAPHLRKRWFVLAGLPDARRDAVRFLAKWDLRGEAVGRNAEPRHDGEDGVADAEVRGRGVGGRALATGSFRSWRDLHLRLLRSALARIEW